MKNVDQILLEEIYKDMYENPKNEQFMELVNNLPEKEKKMKFAEIDDKRIDIDEVPFTLSEIINKYRSKMKGQKIDPEYQEELSKTMGMGVITDAAKSYGFNDDFKKTDDKSDFFYMVKIIFPNFDMIFYPKGHTEEGGFLKFNYDNLTNIEYGIFAISKDGEKVSRFQ
jgi:hypothetical protein